MDPIVVALIILVLVPIAVIWALAKSARLRGPIQRPESKKPVEALVTDVIPEEHPEEDEETTDWERPAYEPESEPPPEPGAPA